MAEKPRSERRLCGIYLQLLHDDYHSTIIIDSSQIYVKGVMTGLA
jgi:hypothetical protein